MSTLRPRLCVLEKGDSGYGFHLHAEKGKSGQYIRLVEPDTPADTAGLRAGDRLALVNGESVEGKSHQQVVARIRATEGALQLVVMDPDTAELLSKHNLQCRLEYVTEGIPVPGGGGGGREAEEEARSNGGSETRENGDSSSERSERLSVSSGTKEERGGPRPRLCYLKKGPNGYGFNLHSEKSKPGQFIRAVDDDTPASRAGLRPQDKIVQVNGVSVLGMQHSEVVTAIKAGGDETSLLVVDNEADEYFKRCKVLPTAEHVNGDLPEPASEEEEAAPAEMKSKTSLSSTSSNASSNNSTPGQVERVPDHEPAPAPVPDGLGPSLSLAQAKERAHQKRAAKKAPAMDWSKRNELFSNL